MIQDITFQQLGLSENMMKAIQDLGFIEPSPIQANSIPVLMQGRDVIGQAQTGTGKTAAFSIPILEQIDTQNKATQALILCPTRELALQVSEEIRKLAKYIPDLFITAIFGGDSIDKQIKFLKKGSQIVVGTPGRVIDHIERGTLDLDEISFIVLDEADEMLNMGFIEDMELILEQLPEEKQTIFFSATMPKPILTLTKKFQNNPELIKVVKNELTSVDIEQFYFFVSEDDKMNLMTRLVEMNNLKLMLAFCNTKQKVDDVVEELQQLGFAAEGLHGNLSQAQRNIVMNRFRKGLLHILVATDVAARGIDVNDVEAVFNYDVPLDPEYYVHRIGRTGRAGKKGISFTFVLRREMQKLRSIEQYTKVQINKGTIPTNYQLAEHRKEAFKNKIIENLSQGVEINEKSPVKMVLQELLQQDYDLQTITQTLLHLQFEAIYQKASQEEIQNIEIQAHKDRREKNTSDYDDSSNRRGRTRERGREREGNKGNNNSQMTKIALNIGKKQKINKGDILGAVANETGLSGQKIGLIEIYDKISFVDVPSETSRNVVEKMSKTRIKGFPIKAEIVR